MTNTRTNAFTLLELAVVLAVVGLMVGGIVVGQSLVEQARLNSVLKDMRAFKTATVQFRMQYNGKAGDLRDAESYFGTDPNGCPTSTVRTPRMTTCNGNGDGVISSTNETWRSWQHLTAAEMLEGVYSGVAGAGGTGEAVAGENVPTSRVRGGAYHYVSFNPGTSNANYYAPTVAGDAIFLGKSVAGSWPSQAILSPADQYQLDAKYDDGKPATGFINAMKSPLNPNCTTSDTAAAEYNAMYISTACTVIYLVDH